MEGLPWERYEQLAACFADTRAVRLSYIDGSLEIRSPIGEEHERVKSNLGVLLEAYFDIRGMRFYRRGGFTLKQPGRAGPRASRTSPTASARTRPCRTS